VMLRFLNQGGWIKNQTAMWCDEILNLIKKLASWAGGQALIEKCHFRAGILKMDSDVMVSRGWELRRGFCWKFWDFKSGDDERWARGETWIQGWAERSEGWDENWHHWNFFFCWNFFQKKNKKVSRF
jgi:hypothetical protein